MKNTFTNRNKDTKITLYACYFCPIVMNIRVQNEVTGKSHCKLIIGETSELQVTFIKNNFQLTFTCSKSTVEATEKGVQLCSKLTINSQERHQ